MRTSLVAVLALVSAACEGPTDTPSHLRAEASGGDGQTGVVGALLPAPLEITVSDETGTPVSGHPVQWRPDANARVVAADAFTAADGTARGRVALGSAVGAASARAAVRGVSTVRFSMVAIEPADLPYDQIVPIHLPTYEGSGQVVHPDHAGGLPPPFGFTRYLAITPYPNGDARKELPSGFVSPSPLGWRLADGAPNPVVSAPDAGYMSDPDVVRVDERGELWMYYRQVTSQNVILLVRTRDGLSWSAPVAVVAAANHRIISPSVVRRGPSDWMMWSVNGTSAGCSAAAATLELRRSSDGIHWSDPAPLELAHDGLTPWHVDVQWIPDLGQFWALYNAKAAGGCATPAVFLATSPDGVVWTPLRTPVLAKGAHDQFRDIVYRSTFEYDAVTDDVLLWYSGASYQSGEYVWGAAVQRRRRAELIEQLRMGDVAPAFTPPPAELTEWP